jgi:hypothetical protein
MKKLNRLLVLLIGAGCSSLFSDDIADDKKQSTAPISALDNDELVPLIDDLNNDQAEKNDKATSGSEDSNSEDSSTQNTIDKAQQEGVEILWHVPFAAVNNYYLQYGSSPDSINNEVKVNAKMLERIDHAAYGPVYRYLLKGVSPKEDIYIRLKAENQFGVSAPTEVLKVPKKSEKKSGGSLPIPLSNSAE